MNKRDVTKQVETFSPHSITGSILLVSERIAAWIEQHGVTATIEYSDDGFVPYSDYPGFCITVDRPETDDEFAARVNYEKMRADEQDAYDRAEFNRLSAKFNKPS